MPHVPAIRFLLALLPVCLLTISVSASAQSSDGSLWSTAQRSASESQSIYRMMSIADVTTVLRADTDLRLPESQHVQSNPEFDLAKSPKRPRAPESSLSQVRLAGFTTSEDVPRPIVLVDCGENFGLNISEQCEPIFESTISSRFADMGASVRDSGQPGGTQCPHGVRCHDDCDACNPCSPWYKVFRSFCSEPTCDEGIGRERIMFAPFDIEVPLPGNFFAIRYDSADGLRSPDRAEYFWAKQGGLGPDAGESRIDYQDLRFIMSAGGKRFSTITEVPLRFIDAAGNGGTGGLGNISIATKLLLIDGQHWKITQFFKTYLNTGSPKRGTANGHVSLEPGLLAQYEWSPTRYWFSELRYWFPTGADPSHGGNVLRYSLGTSKLWYETDTFAVIRTMEFVGTSVLSGRKTLPNGLIAVDVDSEHSMAILPGFRFVLGPAGDLGLFELGLQAGIATNKKGFYTSLGRIELRFNF